MNATEQKEPSIHDEPERDPRGLQDKPILSSGSGGPAVTQLCDALAEVGYETSVSRGENPYAIYDETVEAAVKQFRSEHEEAEEDPAAFGSEQLAASHVGPHFWGALRDAVEKGSHRRRRSEED